MKYYPSILTMKIIAIIEFVVACKIYQWMGSIDLVYFIICVFIVIYSIMVVIMSFTCKMYIDEEGIKRETFFFLKRVGRWEDIEKLVRIKEAPWRFAVNVENRGRILIGFSDEFIDHYEFCRRVVTICEEQYPHIKIDPEIYNELERLEEKEERKQLRRERIKKFFTRSED